MVIHPPVNQRWTRPVTGARRVPVMVASPEDTQTNRAVYRLESWRLMR